MHSKIAAAETFDIDAILFDQFAAWLTKSAFNYESPVENQVKKLLESTRNETEYAALHRLIDSQKEQWKTQLSRELSLHTNEIKTLLEQEIMMHYYLQKGINAWSTRKDPSVLAAIDLLDKPTKFASTLSRRDKL
jgi:carboxyl-terminal processing protease